jgi:hypothetical protein
MLPASSGVPAVSSYLDTGEVTITSLLTSILNWLREGYPEGVPGPDRVPLLALPRATPLTEDQIEEVVRNLTADDSPAPADGAIKVDEIEAFITDVTHHDAGPANVRRVAAILAAAGWPCQGSRTCRGSRKGTKTTKRPGSPGDPPSRPGPLVRWIYRVALTYSSLTAWRCR